ncbi:hypothetical protein CFN78_14430 [Amycolatopsis antarctica]|uniref:Pentapeptide repeat-containing protein n=1 Tax=Amycolatopsis antarctica TaxID=1854586 RepID=A0A263D5X7_9PSEU|nr:pentapeptide repeat-containing protein [Amycolatopsis antarctica]OZM72805.1 hypothetical protein CFN78_14430 [Amycolatopsis antarctica]
MWSWQAGEVARYLAIAVLLIAAAAVLRHGARDRERGRGLPTLPTRRYGDRTMVGSVLGWLFIAVLVLAATSVGLLWLLGWPAFPPAREFGVAQVLELLKIALAVVAGFGGVVLLAVNFRRQKVTEAEHELATAHAEREQTQGYNERFGSAAEQLAHDSAAVRLAGVYAMAGLGDDWSGQRQVCAEVLWAYLRLPVASGAGEAEVRAAVLRVLRDRLGVDRDSHWHALDFDFTGVEFVDTDFSGLRFDGTVIFDGARFSGELTSFQGTRFGGLLSCHGTTFASERTDFSGVEFRGSGRAEFVGARFEDGVLALESVDATAGTAIDFYRCAFAGTTVELATGMRYAGLVRFDRCEFTECPVTIETDRTWIEDGSLIGRVLVSDCTLEGGSLDLCGVADYGAYLRLTDTTFDTVQVVLAGTFPSGHARRMDPARNSRFVARRITLRDTDLPLPVKVLAGDAMVAPDTRSGEEWRNAE